MDAWALTDHGNGSGLAHARAHTQKLQKSGKKYRQLYGVEFYFVPSLSDWQDMYNHRLDVVEDVVAVKKSKNDDDFVDVNDTSDEEQGGHTIEDEEETKKTSAGKPEWKKYYHLVVIAKNRVGLENLFTLVKKSFKDGFHRFPRIDYKMLKEHGEGLVVSGACIGGYPSGLIYKHFKNKAFDDLTPDLVTDPVVLKKIMSDLENMTDRFVDCVGRENFFLELQFNNLSAQHLTNRCLIDLSEKTGIPLIATPDSHFPDPTKWKARELYKKLGWMGAKFDQTMLPKFEDLKCVLYPKNAQQMWDEFNVGYQKYDFYHGKEEIVKSAIERTHDIAWNQCEDTWIDVKAKLPKFDTANETAFNKLTGIVKTRMIDLGLHEKPEYVARVKEELSDIKFLKHASYFLTMYDVFHKAEQRTLLGPGRGCFVPGSRVKMSDRLFAPIETVKIGDELFDAHGNIQYVTNTLSYDIDEDVITLSFDDGVNITCTVDHEFLTQRGWIKACKICDSDRVINVDASNMSKIIVRRFHKYTGIVHDLTVNNSHSYNIEGKAVHNSAPGSLVNFILGITQIDPLEYDLLWHRFLGRHRCLDGTLDVMTQQGSIALDDIQVGDNVMTSAGVHECVIDKEDETNHEFEVVLKTKQQDLISSLNHRWMIKRGDDVIEVMTCDIKKGDKLLVLDDSQPEILTKD